jgi:molybdate transport system ATP-binding protein
MSESRRLYASISGRMGAAELDVELEVPPGTLVVIGPNGAGKTSLLSFLLGVLRPSRGCIRAGESVLFDAEAGIDVPIERRDLGYVPQHFALFPHLDVRANVAFALKSRFPELTRAEHDERVVAALEELGLEKLAARGMQALSGGEQQRVALARVLVLRPRALLLDEPLAALDLVSRREVREFLAGYLEKLALPTLLVSHDARDAHALGSSLLVLERGRVTQRGSFAELRAAPASAFVREFVAAGPAE